MKQNKVNRKIFRRVAGIMALLQCLAGVSGCARDQTQFVQTASSELRQSTVVSEIEDQAEPAARLYVHVCGAVQQPGVYTLDADARVFEAIEAAGGFTEDAAEESINQARILVDGEELYVPTREELLSSSTGSQPAVPAQDDGKVNINTADVQELTTLTGIGETRARAIIAWREQNGGFSAPEDLKNIDGIADKTYEKIKDRITVN